MRRVVMLLVLSSLVGATTVVPAAGAGPDVPDLSGSWRGFTQIVGGIPPDDNTPAALEVLVQEGRRFSGMLSTGEMSCMLDGTLSESSQLSAQGSCGPMSRLVVHGKVTDVNQFGGIVPCVLEGRWTLTSAGSNQQGDLVLLHAEGHPADELAGSWEGAASQEGTGRTIPLTAELRPGSRGEPGEGTIALGDSSFDVIFGLAVPPEPVTPSGFALVGGDPTGLLVMIGRFSGNPPDDNTPAMIEGSHLVLLSSGEISEGTFSLEMLSPDPE